MSWRWIALAWMRWCRGRRRPRGPSTTATRQRAWRCGPRTTRSPCSVLGSANEAERHQPALRMARPTVLRLHVVHVRDRAAGVSGDLAYTVGYEHTTASVNGTPSSYILRVTHVYRRENGEWKVVHRHGDALPTTRCRSARHSEEECRADLVGLRQTSARTDQRTTGMTLLLSPNGLGRLLGNSTAVGVEPGLRLGQGPHRVRSRVTHLEQRLGAQVVDVVAGLVVARVVRRTGRAPVGRGLLRRLDALGAAEQATGRNADRDERAVVGPAVERRRLRCQALAGKVVGEDLLDRVRPRRTGRVGCRSRRRRRRTARSSASPPCRS